MKNLKAAIDVLATKAEKSTEPHDALQFTQAALNIANVFATICAIEEKRPKDNQGPFLVVANTTGVAEQSITNELCEHKRIMRGDKLLMEEAPNA